MKSTMALSFFILSVAASAQAETEVSFLDESVPSFVAINQEGVMTVEIVDAPAFASPDRFVLKAENVTDRYKVLPLALNFSMKVQ